jgi:hypothetical protein
MFSAEFVFDQGELWLPFLSCPRIVPWKPASNVQVADSAIKLRSMSLRGADNPISKIAKCAANPMCSVLNMIRLGRNL